MIEVIFNFFFVFKCVGGESEGEGVVAEKFKFV